MMMGIVDWFEEVVGRSFGGGIGGVLLLIEGLSEGGGGVEIEGAGSSD